MTSCRSRHRRASACESLAALDRGVTEAGVLAARAYARAEALGAALAELAEANVSAITVLAARLPRPPAQPAAGRLYLVPPEPAGAGAADDRRRPRLPVTGGAS
jgi:hypothetical protein